MNPWFLLPARHTPDTKHQLKSYGVEHCKINVVRLDHLLRTVQFDNEISKDLRPRLERTGDADLLQPFLGYFSGRSFQIGTSLLALWEGKCAAFPT